MSIEAIQPATGRVIATYDETPASQLPGIVAHAHEAFLSWRCTGFAQRATMMLRAAELCGPKSATMPGTWPRTWASRCAAVETKQ